MAALPGKQFPDLIQDICHSAAKYDFFQLLRILESIFDYNERALERWLHLTPAPQIGFPATDLNNCNNDNAQLLRLQLNFMGLYGVDSPLPHYFSTQVLKEDDDGNRLKHFLDIFNQRIYQLLYLAWKRSHPHIQLDHPQSLYLHYLRALSGMTLDEIDTNEYALAGLLGARIHNSTGLLGLLQKYLEDTPINIQQFAPRWVNLKSIEILGTEKYEIYLGNNSILGNQALDISGKIIIQVGPVSMKKTMELLPRQKSSYQLGHLIRRYLGPTIEFDVLLIINDASDCLILGKHSIPLGWTSWLGLQQQSNYFLLIHGDDMSKDLINNSENQIKNVYMHDIS